MSINSSCTLRIYVSRTVNEDTKASIGAVQQSVSVKITDIKTGTILLNKSLPSSDWYYSTSMSEDIKIK